AGIRASRADGRALGIAKARRDYLRLLQFRQIIVHLKRAAAKAPIGVWLLAVTARVINYGPVAANIWVFLLIIRQQRLAEVAIAQLLVFSRLHDLAARRIKDLPSLRGQIARTADVLVAFLHHPLGNFLLRGAWCRGQARGAVADCGGVALLQLALARPLARRAFEHAGHHGGDAARLVAVT